MNKKIGLGFIGAGGIAGVHLEQFQQLEQARLIGITDVFKSAAEEKAKRFGVEIVYKTAQDLLENPEIDAVVICVPNKEHSSLAIEALLANKHVLLEKPMALNSEQAKEIVRVQKSTNKQLMVAHQMRWQWHVQQIIKLINKKSFGSIYHVKTGWLRRKGIPGWGSWFTQKAESGGGPLIDIGVHMLDVSLYLMGNPKPVSVFGSTYSEFGPLQKGIGEWGKPDWQGKYDVEDLATALIKMEDGSTLSLDVSWAAHVDTDNQPYVQLLGTEGGAHIRGNQAKILTESFNQTVDLPLKQSENVENDRILLSKHFLESIVLNHEPLIPATSGLTTNLILDAIYESSRTGHEVKLNWDL
ncbi:putative dehydrogenase [Bacillus sp. TS-2]|nr:putative dehydrogenase [Bacillus sp. TS-2]